MRGESPNSWNCQTLQTFSISSDDWDWLQVGEMGQTVVPDNLEFFKYFIKISNNVYYDIFLSERKFEYCLRILDLFYHFFKPFIWLSLSVFSPLVRLTVYYGSCWGHGPRWEELREGHKVVILMNYSSQSQSVFIFISTFNQTTSLLSNLIKQSKQFRKRVEVRGISSGRFCDKSFLKFNWI